MSSRVRGAALRTAVLTLLAASALPALVGSSVSAAPIYVAGVGCNGPFQSNQASTTVSSACDVSVPGTFSPNQGTRLSTGSSSAGAGFLRMSSTAQVFALGINGGPQNLVSTQAWGEWFYDDFIVLGTGSDSTPVLAALNLQISGILSSAVISDRAGSLMTSAATNPQFFFQIDLDEREAGFGQVIRRNQDGVIVETVEGLLIGHYASGDDLADSITSSQLLLPVGTSFRVHVYANAAARASGSVSGSPADEFDFADVAGLSISDFSATVQFPTTGPVFVLPPGYTVHSVSAGIVDNQVVGNQVEPPAVPEPSSLLLLGVGMLYVLERFRARGSAGSSGSRSRPSA